MRQKWILTCITAFANHVDIFSEEKALVELNIT
jgi:hypothetical protein